MIFNINGKDRPFKFSQGTLMEYGKISGFETMNEINESITSMDNKTGDLKISQLENMANLILAGFIVGAKIQGEECDLNTYQVLDIISENPEFMESVNKHIFSVSENRVNNPKEGK